jgi:hypothetical protein
VRELEREVAMLKDSATQVEPSVVIAAVRQIEAAYVSEVSAENKVRWYWSRRCVSCAGCRCSRITTRAP